MARPLWDFVRYYSAVEHVKNSFDVLKAIKDDPSLVQLFVLYIPINI